MHRRITSIYIKFQQNRVSRSVKTVHTHLFATTNSNFEKKSDHLDMHHRISYMYINFQQTRVSRSVQTVHTIYLQIITTCINLQLPIVILKKIDYLDKHHGIAYMYINFQQNRVSRSVKNVHTNLFVKNYHFEKKVWANL